MESRKEMKDRIIGLPEMPPSNDRDRIIWNYGFGMGKNGARPRNLHKVIEGSIRVKIDMILQDKDYKITLTGADAEHAVAACEAGYANFKKEAPLFMRAFMVIMRLFI